MKETTIQDASMAPDVAVRYLQGLISDVLFGKFYTKVVGDSKDLTSPPLLPRYRQPPRKIGHEGASGNVFCTPESYFRKQYYEVIDL